MRGMVDLSDLTDRLLLDLFAASVRAAKVAVAASWKGKVEESSRDYGVE